MIDPPTSTSTPRPEFGTTLSFFAVILFFIVTGILSFRNVVTLDQDSRRVQITHETILALNDLLSLSTDAETGQRGFLLTGDPKYLEPYRVASTNLRDRFRDLSQMLDPGSPGAKRLPSINAHIEAKLSELAESINLRKNKGFAAAQALVMTDRGKVQMDVLRELVAKTRDEEQRERELRVQEMARAETVALVTGVLSTILGIILTGVIAGMVRASNRARMRQEWIQTGQVGLGAAVFGEQSLDRLGDNILAFLAPYLNAQAAAMFVDDGIAFKKVAQYGIPADSAIANSFAIGDGLLGQAAKDRKTFVVHDVPEGYLTIGSALGHGLPKHLAMAPAIADDATLAVLEFGFLHPIDETTVTLLERASASVALAVRSSIDRTRLQSLLEETQRQSEELQTQSEELRVSNEELEEQSRVLKESQLRLELQQRELEQTNTQLEEQAQQLELQRDDLNQSKEALEIQARDLERTSRFKSDFLANMSHELRTPLNSSLILSKLLGDNREGNLTEEQVKYARTIESAGNDLLTLISDILDLSKIESGNVEIHLEEVAIPEMLERLNATFEPIAAHKGLAFRITCADDCPRTIRTDPQRVEQVLKNLLSNAIKFTEAGEVAVEIRPVPAGVSFAVRDTGIGIAPQEQDIVFEAFRQADGTTNRKYGGTGLGLSISRELANLLGGSISVQSEVGRGSTFTLLLPISPGAPLPAPTKPEFGTSVPPSREPVTRPAPANPMNDERNEIAPDDRTLLIVEDDRSFAGILCDLAHDRQFKCLIAATAEEALQLANDFLPSAVLLDIGLPDNSGLIVLDRIKQNDRTRHIPVHVVSGSDYQKTAMALGAVGYMMKPVKREELIRAFEELERLLTQDVKEVLIVEDDPVQLESIQLLLASREVKIVGANSAAECLELLATRTFDCMVLDLSLPDSSGFSLLETLSLDDAYAFPPVIVYTGRDLTPDEEHRLGRFSRSIIVKGAKSPERLLDEVTLFLHQVVEDLPPDQQRLIEQARHRDLDLENKVILVVEDDIRNIFALTSVLEARGVRVEIARNGLEALEVLNRTSDASGSSIDLVLMDIMMPEMDGLAAMRHIRQNPGWKKLPIIALTAKAMKNDQEQCLKAGANDYVAKPLDIEKLLSLIRVWIRRD